MDAVSSRPEATNCCSPISRRTASSGLRPRLPLSSELCCARTRVRRWCRRCGRRGACQSPSRGWTTAGRDAGDCRILTAMRGWLNCLGRCGRQRRALDCCGRVRRAFGVATAWLPDVLDSHTAQKKRSAAEPPVPNRWPGKGGWGWRRGAVTPKLRIRWRGPRKRRLSGLAFGR